MIKIECKKFLKFLNKFRMSGAQGIQEAILKFEKDGLKVVGSNETKISMSESLLKSSAFGEYEAIGNVAMNDLAVVASVIKRFSNVITISKSGNLLTITGEGKKVDIELVDDSFVKEDKAPKIGYEDGCTFKSTAEKFNEIFKDVLVNTDCVLSFKTEGNKVNISNTGKYKFKHEIVLESSVPTISVKFGMPLIDALTQLDGNIEVSINNDYPIRIIETTEDSIITIIVAPRSDAE